MTVVIGGGGTAGHVNPALATAAALRRLRPDVDVEFVGTPDRLEARLVPAAGYVFHAVPALPLRRSLSPSNLRVPFAVLGAARRVARLLRARGARAAVTFGGYTAGPLALGARLAGVPLVVHEQNAVPGLANRLAARWAVRVAVSVPGREQSFPHPDRVVVTGNPVRPALAEADLAALREQALRAFDLSADRRTVLVFGGSLGARRINDAIVASGAEWPAPEQVQILHATGPDDHERVRRAWAAAGAGGGVRVMFRCVPYLDRMDLAYAAADVVVCRAGATSLAELTVLGLPSVLVPYPHAAADEQTANAGALADAGAAAVVPDAELDGARLVAACVPILSDPLLRAAMARAARALGRPGAADAVASLVLDSAGVAAVREDGLR